MSKLIILFYELFNEKFNMIFKANLQSYKNSSSPADILEILQLMIQVGLTFIIL